MLHQPRPQPAATKPLRQLAAAAAGIVAYLLKRRRDLTYLDGMRRSELEELGLRRADDRSYTPFGD